MLPINLSLFIFSRLIDFLTSDLERLRSLPIDLLETSDLNIRANPPGCGLLPAGCIDVPETEGRLVRHVCWSYVRDVEHRQAVVDVALHVELSTVGIQVDHTGDHVGGERHDECLERDEMFNEHSTRVLICQS